MVGLLYKVGLYFRPIWNAYMLGLSGSSIRRAYKVGLSVDLYGWPIW